MQCPICGGDTGVVDCRKQPDCISRRRKCLECDYRFSTVEIDKEWYQTMQENFDKKETEKNMSLACKCDRCGKLYELYPKGTKRQYNTLRRLQNTEKGFLTDDPGKSTIDLCEDCMGAFEHFMTTGGRFGL